MNLSGQPHADAVLRGVILAALALIWVTIVVRTNGPRSFSKMTSFDFVVTVATGSLLAGAAQATAWPGFLQALAATAGLILFQRLLARATRASEVAGSLVQNRPVLLMRDGEMIDDAMDATRVAEGELIAKLREANVLDLSEVRAVVLETTGDISVLHGDKNVDELLEGVSTG